MGFGLNFVVEGRYGVNGSSYLLLKKEVTSCDMTTTREILFVVYRSKLHAMLPGNSNNGNKDSAALCPVEFEMRWIHFPVDGINKDDFYLSEVDNCKSLDDLQVIVEEQQN